MNINSAISAAGSSRRPTNIHFTKDIGPNPAAWTGLVGVPAGIVYGPLRNDDLRRPFGASYWIGSATCLHNSAGTDVCSADLSLRSAALIPVVWASRAAESMRDVFDIYTIIFLALAVFIFLRLRSVLGQRTGRERPPYDPYSARDAVRGSTNDNVVTLPGRGGDAAAEAGRAGRAGGALEGHRRDRLRRSPPASMPSRARTRASTPSISSPARARPTR